MNASARKLFNVVFREAHVMDFDFSEWDRRLRLIVVAGLTPENFDKDTTLHAVDFDGVEELSWRANHLHVKLNSPDQHCQWVIDEFEVRKRFVGDYIALYGSSPCPRLELLCRDVRIATMDPRLVDRVNPPWNRPWAPLCRPGIEGLARLRRRP